MSRHIMLLVLAAAILLACAPTAADTIYTWTDDNGVRHMTNIPPVQSSGNVEILELEPPPVSAAPDIQYALPEEPAPPANETAVDIIDNHVIVPVLLSYKGREVTARLLLDTGSAYITLHRSVARKLLIKKTRKGRIRVAGGDIIDAEAVWLDQVTVGPHRQRNMAAGIIEHRGDAVPFDGLLGMNFLKKYRYTIDFEHQVLRWSD